MSSSSVRLARAASGESVVSTSVLTASRLPRATAIARRVPCVASPRVMSGVVWTRFWGREGGTVTGSTSGAGAQLALTRCTWRVRPGPPRTGLGALAALRFSGEEEGHGRGRTLSLGNSGRWEIPRSGHAGSTRDRADQPHPGLGRRLPDLPGAGRARPGRHCSSSRRRASTTTASLLAEALWPGHDMWVRDVSEFGGLLEGTAMWPQATPDDLDPRHLIGQFGTELLSAARLGTGTTGALGAILGALRTPRKSVRTECCRQRRSGRSRPRAESPPAR